MSLMPRDQHLICRQLRGGPTCSFKTAKVAKLLCKLRTQSLTTLRTKVNATSQGIAEVPPGMADVNAKVDKASGSELWVQ